MPKQPKPKPVRSPGSYNMVAKAKERKAHKAKAKAKVSRPAKKSVSGRKNEKRREGYTEEDVAEGVRLVREEEFSLRAASEFVNSVKKNKVPRSTIGDRVRSEKEGPVLLGRPQELPTAVEEKVVECLELTSEFQFPMTKDRLQDLVADFCDENSVETRWTDNRPGKDWIRSFKKRWIHRIKVKRATNIKRSRAKVSPADVRKFFERWVNLEIGT